MRLTRIVTLANAASRLRFLAMERSLRACGCDLPLAVIPFNDDLFDLPPRAEWWVVPELLDWLRAEKAHPMMAKYQCLTIADYHFVDTDVIFLRNPAEALAQCEGFVASCGQWRDPYNAVNETSLEFFRRRSSLWQRLVFNAGQFACDRALYPAAELKAKVLEFAGACFKHPRDPFLVNDQTGLNLLVLASGVPVTNLNLPPSRMESTWAGDYPGEYAPLWTDAERTPYMIHWAGVEMTPPRPLNDLFYKYLTPAERMEWDRQAAERAARVRASARSPRVVAGRFKKALVSALKSP